MFAFERLYLPSNATMKEEKDDPGRKWKNRNVTK